MRTKRFRVTLTPAERDELYQLISTGTAAARKLMHARILLKADPPPGEHGPFDADIAQGVAVSVDTVERVRRRFVEEGLAALVPRPATAAHVVKRDGRGEARLIAEVLRPPPQGKVRWTLRWLAARLVELQVIESISYETVRQRLKKRVEAVADDALVPAAAGQCRLRGPDGRRAGRLPLALRLRLSHRLPR